MYNLSKDSEKSIFDGESESEVANEREYLIDIARKTWSYFKENQVNYLPADNFQEDRKEKVAMRTSPTNIGFSLMAAIVSYDLHFENLENTIEFINNEINSVDMLKKWNGHLYNWYDLKNMQPLAPFDISSVDKWEFRRVFIYGKSIFLKDCLNGNNCGKNDSIKKI